MHELRPLETLQKHGLVSTFRICFLKEKSLEKWRRTLLRLACPGSVDSCDCEVDNLSYTWTDSPRIGIQIYFCEIGPTHLPHPGLQHTNTVHPDVSAEYSCSFCSSWTYSCRWSYLIALEGFADSKETSVKNVKNQLFQLCIIQSFCSEGWDSRYLKSV